MERIYETFVGTLHCMLENGADLYVNERQKMRHYRARSIEEKRSYALGLLKKARMHI